MEEIEKKSAPSREITFQMNFYTGLVDIMIGRMKFMECKYENTQDARKLLISLKKLEVQNG